MLKRIIYIFNVIVILLLGGSLEAQEKKGTNFYLPYNLSSHSALKFDSYLMNPAFPIMGEEESNISIYHRNQWLNFTNHYTSYGLAYGKKWSEQNMVNAMLYKHDLGIFTNYGVISNYGHFLEFSDQVGLRLGLNLMFGMSGINDSKVILPVPGTSSPILENNSNAFMVNVMPGFDFNFGEFHIGVTAENLFDYAISSGSMAVPFGEKTFTGHVMYRHTLIGADGLFEEGVMSIIGRAQKTPNTFNLSGSAMLDLPNAGWAYLGYAQDFGVYAGLGFNISPYLSIGLGYEQGIAAKIKELGGTYQAQINYQFGGRRHERDRILKEKLEVKKKEREARAEAKKRSEEWAKANPKEEKPKTPVVKKEKDSEKTVAQKENEAPKQTPEKANPLAEMEKRLGVRADRIGDDKVATGYYVVIGVYRDARNAYRMIQDMRKNGLDVYGFVNPANGMTYVNIGGAQSTPHSAEKIMMDNIYNKAFDGIWILKISR